MKTLRFLSLKKAKYGILILFTFLFTNNYSQDCISILEEAEKLFQQGFLEEIPQKLSGCLEKGFTKTQKLSAYKLIILSYLYDDQQTEANKYMYSFLKDFPEYELETTDPDVFTHLFNTFNTKSILAIGITGGGNRTNYRLIEKFSLVNSLKNNSEYTPGYGFNVGAVISKNVMDNIDVNLEIYYSQVTFIDNDKIINTSTVEDISYLEIYLQQ